MVVIATKGLFVGTTGPTFKTGGPPPPVQDGGQEFSARVLSLTEEDREQNIGVTVKHISEKDINGDK